MPTLLILGGLVLWFIAFGSGMSHGWIVAAVAIGLVVVVSFIHGQRRVRQINHQYETLTN